MDTETPEIKLNSTSLNYILLEECKILLNCALDIKEGIEENHIIKYTGICCNLFNMVGFSVYKEYKRQYIDNYIASLIYKSSLTWEHPLKNDLPNYPIKHYDKCARIQTLWEGEQLDARISLLENTISVLIKETLKES